VSVDPFDQPVRELRVGYPRRATATGIVDDQRVLRLRLTDTTYINIDTDDRYELGLPSESAAYELGGLRPGPDGLFTREQLVRAQLDSAIATAGRHDLPPADIPMTGPAARRLSREQTFYWDDARTDLLPLGQAGTITLLHHEEAVAFEDAFVGDAYGGRVDATLLVSLGYHLRDGLWWQPDAVVRHSTFAEFSLPVGTSRADGAETSVEHDPHYLVATGFTDALGNQLSAEIDYQRLALWRISDPNGSVREVRYDPLGVVVAATHYGHVGTAPWGFAPVSSLAYDQPVTLGTVIAAAGSSPQGVQDQTWYDLDAWSSSAQPTAVVSLIRERYVDDGAGGHGDDLVHVGVTYLDAFGRVLQRKVLVEDGPAIVRDAGGNIETGPDGQPVLAGSSPRWQASGHVAYDSKQRPIRVFEPFFTTRASYESDAILQALGTSTLSRYDVLGRPAGQDFADGTLTRRRYGAWQIDDSDQNDLVLDSPWGSLRQGLPLTDPRRIAFDEASPHAATARSTFLDSLGQECGVLERGGSTAPDRQLRRILDIEGREIGVVDPRGLTSFAVLTDMQGGVVRQSSIDAGTSWHLADAYGREARVWDERGFVVARSHDLADRHTATDVTGGDGPTALDNRVEVFEYGDSLADRAGAAAGNLIGRVVTTKDGSGVTTVVRSDPAGRALAVQRQLRSRIDAEPDWRTAEALEAERFTETAVVDALGRPAEETLADGTVRRTTYSRGGTVTAVAVTTPDGALTDQPILTDVTTNARGQREGRTFGNGVAVSYGYDPQVYRLTAQTATLGGQSLQSIAYVYDPVGNVVQSTDAAQEGAGALVHGVTVPAVRRYQYDAHYRLLSATGRVHQALLQHDYVPGVSDTLKGTRHISFNNGQAVERFTRTYTYDKSGNLTTIKHAGTSRNWTTQMWVSPTSNRSTPAFAPNGVPVSDPESYFDVAGNQVVLAHLRSIGWDWHGRLSRAVTVSRPGGTDNGESYVYGADSLRARKVATRVVGAGIVETTEYVWFGDAERKRISQNGTVLLERWSIGIGDGEERIAFVDRWIVDSLKREVDVPQARTRYQLTVTSASVAIELDDSGGLLSYEEYFPYGGTAFIAGDNLRAISAKDYRWAGKMADDATGLYCFGYRYFVPWTGRWLSCDPLGPQDDVNLYQFALGNPIGNRDVDGLQTEKEKPPVVYTERPYVKPADESEAAKVAAMRASLPANFQALFDSLSASDQVRMATGPSGSVAMVPKDLDNLGAGARVISLQEFRRTYLPALARWSKAHGVQAIVQVPPSAEASADDGGLGEQSEANEGDGDDPGKSQDKGDGGGGKKTDASADGSGEKNPTAPGDGQQGSGKGEGTGTDPSSEQGSTTGTDGTGPGGVKPAGAGGKIPGGQGAGAGAGKDTGKAGSGSGAGPGSGSTSTPNGSVNGNEFGVAEGGSDEGIIGGVPFATGTSLQALANPISGGSAANGSDKDGQPAGGTRRGSGGAGGTGSPGPAGQQPGSSSRRGGAAGSGTNPGSQKNGAGTATAGHGSRPNQDATQHGKGDASANGQPGGGKAETGTMATTLKVAGYLNLTFGEDAGGAAGGIPGGMGSLRGRFWQYLYIGLTAIETILIIHSLVKSIAAGGLRRLARLLSPRRLLRDFAAFLREGGAAWRVFWRRIGSHTPWTRFKQILKALVWDTRSYKSIRRWRNQSFLFRPRFLGTLERVGQRSLYTWEHIIPQSLGRKFPWLRPFINSYLNSALRLPWTFNSALQDRLLPKLLFYSGAAAGAHKAWQIGTWIGHFVLGDDPSNPPAQTPASTP
jgi:RHS repeat-associated protein